MEDVKIRKNFGVGDETTKGISQIDYFENKGIRVKALGVVKDLGTYVDLFNFARFIQAGGPNTSESLPLNLGPLTLLWELAGVMMDNYTLNIDKQASEVWQRQLEEAKLQGYEATEKFISATKHKQEFEKDPYKWLDASPITANKLLRGEFKTFEDLEATASAELDVSEVNIRILYRRITLEDRIDHFNFIIETLFLDE